MQKSLSPVQTAGIVIVVVVLFGGLFWLGSGRKSAQEEYSNKIAQKEGTAEFEKSVDEYNKFRQQNKDALRANRELTRDRDYQPESGANSGQ